MRSELTTLEQIDSYLSGNLSPAEQAAFEAEINADPNLESMVSQQKELIKAVNRQALRAQISAVAAAGGAAGGGMSNVWIGITSVVGIGLVTAGLVYFNSEGEVQSDENIIAVNNTEVIEADTNATNFESIEEGLIYEEPETIFSSINTYEELDDNLVNEELNFVASDEVIEIDYNANEGGVLREVTNDEPAINTVEKDLITGADRTRRASYPGGNYAMDQFIDKNLHYPRSARNKGLEGVVRCEFFVTADGVITEIDAKCIKMNERDGPAFNDVKLLMNKRIMNAFINNATHTLRTMPNWEPATNSQGNPILTEQHMYFNYDLKRGCLVYQLDESSSADEKSSRREQENLIEKGE